MVHPFFFMGLEHATHAIVYYILYDYKIIVSAQAINTIRWCVCMRCHVGVAIIVRVCVGSRLASINNAARMNFSPASHACRRLPDASVHFYSLPMYTEYVRSYTASGQCVCMCLCTFVLQKT